MNNLYSSEIITQNENLIEVIISFSNKEHEVFKAHFPSNSLLPGFLQIDIIAEILGIEVLEVKKAKFLQAILPLDKVLFSVSIKDNKYKVITKKDDKKCSEFVIVKA